MKRKILKSKSLILWLIFGFSLIACHKDGTDTPAEDVPENSYIPKTNVKYEYNISEDGENIGTLTKWIDESRDSSGIKLYSLHSNLVFSEGSLGITNEMYVANGKTYTKLDMPEAWKLVEEEMKKNPDIIVEESKYTGFPAYMIIENAMREGSKLTWEIPVTMGQYFRYRDKDSQSPKIEITQTIEQHPGAVVTLETLTVPAGTFPCSKIVYQISQEQVAKINGDVFMSASGMETITLWMAHGIGVVKEDNITVFDGNTNHTITVLNRIKT
ncbi:hypothetical protein SAMN05216436_105194 [bacterium A37T11]|nr:hypothetical protein SAMN05216436_105194 [bacterium A37T11]